MDNKDASQGVTAGLLAEWVLAVVNHLEQSPGGQGMDDPTKSSILKSAAALYDNKMNRDAMVAALYREFSD